MATFKHPASLNALQQYSQACAVLRNTTRARNAAWYQDALDLDFQLHLRVDGAGVSAFYHHRSKEEWIAGPSLTDESIRDESRIESLASEAIRQARSAGVTALGVILHVADEFATTELKPELDNPAALAAIRDAAVNDPASILADSSIQADLASWRVMPYPASGAQAIATSIALSRQYEPLVSEFRNAGERENFPVVTAALSAPLVAILGLGQSVDRSPGRPFVAILQYPWFTTLAFFNEHADLKLIRTLQHRGLRRPTNFRNALSTTNASLEFVDPDLFLVPLGANVDATLDADLRVTFYSSRVEVVPLARNEKLPVWCPEPGIAANLQEAPASGAPSHTFTILHDEKWPLQDFLPTPKDIQEIYPSRSEMKLLSVLRLARVAVFAIAALSLAYFVVGAVGILRKPEWSFDPAQNEVTKTRLAMMMKSKAKIEHWSNLMDDRSKAWVNMESFSRMVSENGGMLVKTYNYSAKPESAVSGPRGGPSASTKIGFTKEWKITGFARDEALDYLNSINTNEGISAHFTEIARVTGNPAFSTTTATRNLVVNVRTQENSAFKPASLDEAAAEDTSSYPFTFDLTITQRFEPTDPMAITVAKAP
ncbi:MAG: hypothetical protein V4640_00135 [Verrucomicrobiota bacterium]